MIILVFSTVALLYLLVSIGICSQPTLLVADSLVGAQWTLWEQPTRMAVVFVILVQPVVILYFFYWRTRRHQTSLDLVIKCFAIGYWLSSVQSQALVAVTMSIFYAVAEVTVGVYKMSDASSAAMLNGTNTIQLTNLHDYALPQFSNVTRHNADDELHVVPPIPIDLNIRAFIASIFYISLVLRAAIDESVKHYIVRCFPFTSPLKNPQCVLGTYVRTHLFFFCILSSIDCNF